MSNKGVQRLGLISHLLGSLEIALFMPKGAERFCTSRAAMKRSFLIPLMILPLTLITVLAAHPHGDMGTGTAHLLMAVYSLRLVVYLAGFLAVIYMMAKSMDRLESFYRFATANNWLTIPAAVLATPLLLMFFSGYHSWENIYPMMVFITLYSYAYTAFMATYVLRVPWEMAAFVAIIGMAIHQTSLDVVKWVAVNTVYLVS